MTAYRAPLTPSDRKLLLCINMKARLPPAERQRAERLVHLGLVNETPLGFSLTAAGKEECRKEIRRGLTETTRPVAKGPVKEGAGSSPGFVSWLFET